MAKKNIAAIAYDFDGTLAPGNMQEHSFIPEKLQVEKEVFWERVKKSAKANDMDQVLSYLDLTIEESKKKNVPFNKKAFNEYGKKIPFFPGVDTWFDRINKYARSKGVILEHYIISSGIKSIIDGTKIRKHFKYVFACEFKYDANNVAVFPAVAINYTTKTQYLFRINKGILNNWDNSVNEFTPDEQRPIPFSRLIYIGDGATDVPAMKMTNYKGGYSIGVFDPSETKKEPSPKKICESLLENKRCSFIAPADYRKNQRLDKMVRLIIDKIHYEKS